MFSVEDMQAAMNEVINEGSSISEAARIYKVKRRTLSRYVIKQTEFNKNPEEKKKLLMGPHYDVRPIFSENQEKIFVDFIDTRNKLCYGITIKEFRHIAYQVALQNKLNIPNSWKTNETAGRDWYRSFRSRNPEISLRKPEACSLNRLLAFNKENIAQFYKNLHDILKANADRFSDGSRIFNLDETGFTYVQKLGRVLARMGSKKVTNVTSAERGALVTICCAISAAGTTVPPVFIFPRVNFQHHMIKGAPNGSLGLASPKGWMTTDLFIRTLEHFIKYTSASEQNPVLLIVDNHETHASLEALLLAKRNGVILLTLPPHCSDRLQPLDRSVFGPFKTYYSSQADSWMLRNLGLPITIYDIAELIGNAFDSAMSIKNIKAGFSATGIYPYNPDIFSDEDFIESLTATYKKKDQFRINVPDSNGGSLNSVNFTQSPLHSTTISENDQLLEITPGPDTKNTETPAQLNSELGNVDISPPFVSPYDVTDLPDLQNPKNPTEKKKRQKGKSTILTSMPEIELKRKRVPKGPQPKEKRKKSRKQLIFESDDSSIDEPVPVESLIVVKSRQKKPESQNLKLKTGIQEPQINDFVLIKFQVYNLRQIEEIHYTGQIQKITKTDLYVSFLRKQTNYFVFPEVKDEAYVRKQDIVKVFSLKSTIGKITIRLTRHLEFQEDLSSYKIR